MKGIRASRSTSIRESRRCVAEMIIASTRRRAIMRCTYCVGSSSVGQGRTTRSRWCRASAACTPSNTPRKKLSLLWPGVRAQFDHEADGIGVALPQAATSLVGHIAHRRSRLDDPAARLLADVDAPVEGPRHGTDGNVELLRQPPDALHIRSFPYDLRRPAKNVYGALLTCFRRRL